MDFPHLLTVMTSTRALALLRVSTSDHYKPIINRISLDLLLSKLDLATRP